MNAISGRQGCGTSATAYRVKGSPYVSSQRLGHSVQLSIRSHTVTLIDSTLQALCFEFKWINVAFFGTDPSWIKVTQISAKLSSLITNKVSTIFRK